MSKTCYIFVSWLLAIWEVKVKVLGDVFWGKCSVVDKKRENGGLDNQGSLQKIDPSQLFDFLQRLWKEIDIVSRFIVELAADENPPDTNRNPHTRFLAAFGFFLHAIWVKFVIFNKSDIFTHVVSI